MKVSIHLFIETKEVFRMSKIISISRYLSVILNSFNGYVMNIYYHQGFYTIFPSKIYFFNVEFSWRRRDPTNVYDLHLMLTIFYKEFYNITILTFIKGYKKDSWFWQWYQTNYWLEGYFNTNYYVTNNGVRICFDFSRELRFSGNDYGNC